MRFCARVCVPLLAVSIVAARPHGGGSPIITLQELPDYLVVGEATTFTYVARQHGSFVNGDYVGLSTIDGRSIPVRRDGDFFHVTFTPDAAGPVDVQLTLGIPGNFRRPTGEVERGVAMLVTSMRKLLPIEAIPRGAPPPQVKTAERGRRLFVAKGCISCHRHAAAGISGGSAPELTGRAYAPDWFERLVSDPYSTLPDRGPYGAMPILGLSRSEIEAIGAFLTSTQRAAGQ